MKAKPAVCPWWLGFILINPFRKLIHNPQKLLGEYITQGMNVVDYGSAMGYFSLPIAEMTGQTGKVYCFDIQKKMLKSLVSRARKSNLEERIIPCLIGGDDDFQNLYKTIDFSLLFAVAHEVPDQKQLFSFLSNLGKQGSLLFFAEPKGHVKPAEFDMSVNLIIKAGYAVVSHLKVINSYAVLFKKE